MTSIDGMPILLLALQHGDSQFPSGGFAFSQGLEASSQLSDTLGEFRFSAFLHAQIYHRWAVADRVAVVRAHRLGQDFTSLVSLDQEVEASTVMESLRTGSRRNGTAFLTSHSRLHSPGASAYRALLGDAAALGHLSVVQGLVWRGLGFDETSVMAMSGYQAAASLSAAAVRLGLIGAIEAQSEIANALSMIAEASQREIADDEPIRSFVPLAEIAVALHGASGQRLFSN
jgi:urease accessory protein